MYKKNLVFNDNFRYSININMDLHNEEKINSFIVTKTATDLLTGFIDNIESSNSKPQLFIGPYGKGKSHLLLVLGELLYSNKFDDCKALVDKLIKSNSNFKEKIEKIREKRYLPIVLTGSYDSFKPELILEIKKRLEKEGFDQFDIETAYGQAEKLLANWRCDKHAKIRLDEYLKNKRINIDKLNDGLKNLKITDLVAFKNIYRYMMYGQKFEPLVNENITNIIREVSAYLEEQTEFDGLVLIMDEFSKLLEGNAAAEVYADIQNLAELTGSSSFRMICVAHKRIGAYTDHLSNEKRNEWKKIEGRFDQLFFGMFEDQSYYYKLIEKAVSKQNINEKRLYKISKDIFSSFSYAYTSSNIDEQLIVEGAFPLNPYTAYCLIKLSEKIGQNERSIFTFLCGEQNNGLRKLVDRGGEELISVDVLYDYFSNTLEGNKNSKAYKIYVKAETILENLDNINDIKIIKTLAIFHMIDDNKVLIPKCEYIQRALNNDPVEDNVNQLISKGLLLSKAQNNYLSFIAGAGSNVQKDIDKIIDLNYKHIKYGELYNKLFNNKYITPKRYNYNNAITRFFKVKFIESELFCHDGFNLLKYLYEEFADGYIVYIVCSDECEREKVRLITKLVLANNVICIILEDNDSTRELMLNLLAICDLIDNKKKYNYDEFVNTELKLLKSEYEYSLDQYFGDIVTKIQYYEGYYMGKQIENNENALRFNNFLSEICEANFKYYPRMNYELINKNEITTQAKNARRYSIRKLFDEEFESVNLRETSAEKTMYRVLVEKTGIAAIQESDYSTVGADENKRYIRVFNKIHRYFVDANEKSKIYDLYALLQAEPYGLRKGVISIFLAKYLSAHKKNTVVVMNNKEVSLTLSNFEFIDDQPGNFVVYISHETKATEEYLKRVNKLYMSNKVYNDLNIYDETFKRVEDYVKKLPSCAKNLSYVFYDYDYIKLSKTLSLLKREFLKFNVNAKVLLTNKVPRKIYKGKSYKIIEDEFIRLKEIYDTYVDDIKKYLIYHVKSVLGFDEKMNIRSSFVKWSKELKTENLKYVDNYTFVKLVGSISNHLKDTEVRIIEDIAYVITGVAIEDWNDKSFEIFKTVLESINEIYKSLDNVNHDTKNKTKIVVESSEYELERYFSYIQPSEDVIAVTNEIDDLIEEYVLDEKDKQALIFRLIKIHLKGEL